MRTSVTIVALVAVSALLASEAMADGPNLTPGKWQFDTTVEMSMMPQPKTQSDTKCITKEEAEADPLAAIIEEGRCKVLSQKKTSNSLEFEIECEGDPKMNMKMRGNGVFTGNGDSASGKMDMVMDMPKMPEMPEMQGMPQMGGKMTMNQTWTGKRLGDCD